MGINRFSKSLKNGITLSTNAKMNITTILRTDYNLDDGTIYNLSSMAEDPDAVKTVTRGGLKLNIGSHVYNNTAMVINIIETYTGGEGFAYPEILYAIPSFQSWNDYDQFAAFECVKDNFDLGTIVHLLEIRTSNSHTVYNLDDGEMLYKVIKDSDDCKVDTSTLLGSFKKKRKIV